MGSLDVSLNQNGISSCFSRRNTSQICFYIIWFLGVKKLADKQHWFCIQRLGRLSKNPIILRMSTMGVPWHACGTLHIRWEEHASLLSVWDKLDQVFVVRNGDGGTQDQTLGAQTYVLGLPNFRCTFAIYILSMQIMHWARLARIDTVYRAELYEPANKIRYLACQTKMLQFPVLL